MLEAKGSRDYTIVIIDDDTSVVSSVNGILSPLGFTTKSYLSVKSFLEGLPSLIAHYDKICLLLDLHLSQKLGFRLADELNKKNYSCPMILTAGTVRMETLIEFLQNGNFHFLAKPIDPSQLLDTLAQAIKQHEFQVNRQETLLSLQTRFATLTTRELSVLKLMADGQTSLAIAKHLSISIKTVEYHRHNIRRKLAVNSFAELITLAVHYQQAIASALQHNESPPLQQAPATFRGSPLYTLR